MVDVSQSKVNLTFKHYEQDFFTIKKAEIKKSLDDLAKMYPVFVNGDYKNPTKIFELNNYLNNDLNKKLFNDWSKRIGNYDQFTHDLNTAFTYYHHYYPSDTLPEG